MSSLDEAGDDNKLAKLLRESVGHIERGEFDPVLEQTLKELEAYIIDHKPDPPKATSGSGVGSLGSTIGKKLGKISLNSKKEKQQAAQDSRENAQRAKEMLHDIQKPQDEAWSSWWSGSQDENKPAPAKPGKPPFQRPNNPKFPMIANGWVEQQRRSKMRVVWKGVLISLVKGRNPKEETTLWIQREINNASTGKRELEALHQVPIKWLEDVAFLDFYSDNRFSIKVYNVSEEFYFRCADEDSAQQWVLALRSIKDEVTGNNSRHSTSIMNNSSIHSTSMMNNSSIHSTNGDNGKETDAPKKSQSDLDPTTKAQSAPEQFKPRQSIKELRAIAHGAGINTQGMERSDLERVVEDLQKPVSNLKDDDAERRASIEAARLRQEQEAQRKVEEVEIEEQKKRQHEEDEKRKIELEKRQRVAETRRKAEEERRMMEEQRRALLLAEEQRRVLLLAEEQRRKAEEQRRQVEEQRRRQEEERRRQEEAAKLAQQHYQQQQQQWKQQQAAQQQWKQQQAAAAQQRAQAAQQAQWNHWRQQQQQQQQYAQQHAQRKPQQPYPTNGNNQSQQQFNKDQANSQTSTADLKYTKMAEESNQGGEEKITTIKRNILLHWALQPPTLQSLRPITDLISNVHSVFPPAFGVAGHEYFGKWNAISREELVPVGVALPDEEKLKKAVRKLRFFLHPDKLPRDLNEEQSFMCKMLWDISSDAWEEFKKRDEELDWIQK